MINSTITGSVDLSGLAVLSNARPSNTTNATTSTAAILLDVSLCFKDQRSAVPGKEIVAVARFFNSAHIDFDSPRVCFINFVVRQSVIYSTRDLTLSTDDYNGERLRLEGRD